MQTEMKNIAKYLLAAVLLAAACGELHAQTADSDGLFVPDAGRRRTRLRTEWNIMAGATVAGWSADNDAISFDPRVGYHIGFDMGLLVGARCAIVPELRFTHIGVNIANRAGGITSIRSNGIDMPLMFEYRILRGRLRFHAGPSFTLMDRNSSIYRNAGTEYADDIVRLRPTVTWVAGVRGVIGRRVSVGLRFNGQFNRTDQIVGGSENDAGYAAFRMGSWRLSVSVGYRF